MKTLMKNEMFKKDQVSSNLESSTRGSCRELTLSQSFSWPMFGPNETSWQSPTRPGSFSSTIRSKTPTISTWSWSSSQVEI